MHINRENIAKYYKKMQVDTASNEKQIVMLHDKLFTLVRDSIIHGKNKRRERLDKAQNILAQLQIALKSNNSEDEVIQSLFLLYDYVYVRLEKDDIAGHREGLKVIEIIRETFTEQYKRK